MRSSHPRMVYPRPRGGTVCHRPIHARHVGLSPPTRGNRDSAQVPSGRLRSIPAHAGEPRSAHARDILGRVYPRPRGGTRARRSLLRRRAGLSPPTRGNPMRSSHPRISLRSIPAHAGEPFLAVRARPVVEVYPRPRGGTAGTMAATKNLMGLSPPTRGNPLRWLKAVWPLRSIPAHAGEPYWDADDALGGEVYPRPRGGTLAVRRLRVLGGGLSPPTRGNRGCPPRLRRTMRSIPAHAGEPLALAY